MVYQISFYPTLTLPNVFGKELDFPVSSIYKGNREQGTGNRGQGAGGRVQGAEKKHSFAPV